MGEGDFFITEINTHCMLSVPIKIETVAHELLNVVAKNPFIVCWSDFNDRANKFEFDPMCYVFSTRDFQALKIVNADCFNTQGMVGWVDYKGWHDNLLNEKREDEKEEEVYGEDVPF
jgi:hypothetical protein